MIRCCIAGGCSRQAKAVVVLVNGDDREVDGTCPVICRTHAEMNEKMSRGDRLPGKPTVYPYTNQCEEDGWTEYIPIDSPEAREALATASQWAKDRIQEGSTNT